MDFAVIRSGEYCFDVITSNNLVYKEAGIELRMFFMNHMKEIMDGNIDPQQDLLFVPSEEEINQYGLNGLTGRYKRFTFNHPEEKGGDYSTKIEGTEISLTDKRSDFKYGSKFVSEFFLPDELSESYEEAMKAARENSTLLSYTEGGSFHIIDQAGMQFQMISKQEYLKKEGVKEGTLKKQLNKREVEAIIYDKHYTTINSFFPPEMLKQKRR